MYSEIDIPAMNENILENSYTEQPTIRDNDSCDIGCVKLSSICSTTLFIPLSQSTQSLLSAIILDKRRMIFFASLANFG
jgi:hypothetical protein